VIRNHENGAGNHSLIEVVDGVDLFPNEVVQAVGSAREEQAVTDPLDRLDATESVVTSAATSSRLRFHLVATHVSVISLIRSKAASTPSSPMGTPELRASLYASRSNCSKYSDSALVMATRLPDPDHVI
jgi:hypothetical protein